MANRLFRTLVSCCGQYSFYQFRTDLYPVYLTLCTYQTVYTDLAFLEFTYTGSTVSITNGTAGA